MLYKCRRSYDLGFDLEGEDKGTLNILTYLDLNIFFPIIHI